MAVTTTQCDEHPYWPLFHCFSQYTVFINGVALGANDIEQVKTDGPKFFSMDWAGLVAIAFDDETKPKNPYIGLIDDVYMFPCVLNAQDIATVQKFCGEYSK